MLMIVSAVSLVTFGIASLFILQEHPVAVDTGLEMGKGMEERFIARLIFQLLSCQI